jgi:hypothetical protein
MRYKDEYRKMKEDCHDDYCLMMEMKVLPIWHLYAGEQVIVDRIFYNVTYVSPGRGKTRVKLVVHGTEFYYFLVSSTRCHFRGSVKHVESKLLFTSDVKEFFKYLHRFEDDLRFRLETAYYHLSDNMTEECREIVREVLNRVWLLST